MPFTEATYEQAIIELFEQMGYTHLYAPELERDYESPLLDAVLLDSLARINKKLPPEAIQEAIGKLKSFEGGSLIEKNRVFMDYLQNGIEIKYFAKGEERAAIVYLLDYQRQENNTFQVVNQFTYIENGNNRRPDILLFINGLPLVLMELKSPSKDEVGAENAYNQIRNYMQDIPSLFIYKERRKVLDGEDLQDSIQNMLHNTVENAIRGHLGEQKHMSAEDFREATAQFRNMFLKPGELELTDEELQLY